MEKLVSFSQDRLSRWWSVEYVGVDGPLADVVLESSRDAEEAMDRILDVGLFGRQTGVSYANSQEVHVLVFLPWRGSSKQT